MKKKNLTVLLGGLLLLTACGGNGAGDSLQKYLDAMVDKDYEAVVNGMSFKNEPTEEQKKQYAALIEAKSSEKTDNIEKYKVLKDSVIVEDSLAVVTYETVYKSGDTKTDTQTMVKKDGKWLMDVGK